MANKSTGRNHLAAAAIVLFLMAAGPALASGVDNTLYADLLARHVREGVVDYAGFKAEEARLDAYLAVLEATDYASLPRGERLAFWINVYNAYTIKLVLSEYPDVSSIKDIGGFFTGPWSQRIIPIAGPDGRKPLHLDDVEKNILLPRFSDPRVHFAINCASRSCPPLLDEPYDGARIDAQLDERTRSFINDPAQTALSGGTLTVSRIFKWYEDDFGDDVAGYVARYAVGGLARKLAATDDPPRVRFRDYDWSLNGR